MLILRDISRPRKQLVLNFNYSVDDKKLNQNANLLIQDQNEPKNIEEKRKANWVMIIFILIKK